MEANSPPYVEKKTEHPTFAYTHRSTPPREASPHLPSAVANELTEVGWPQVALPVHGDCWNSILDDPAYQQSRRARMARRGAGWFEPGRNSSKGAA
jgi:hypothetical protein